MRPARRSPRRASARASCCRRARHRQVADDREPRRPLRAQGKTVLVVSDRRRRWAIVQQRLASIGLAELCLALRQSRAGARALERVLDATVSARSGPNCSMASGSPSSARPLDGHASALHASARSDARCTRRSAGSSSCARRRARRSPSAMQSASTRHVRAPPHRGRGAREAAVRVEPVATHPWRDVDARQA